MWPFLSGDPGDTLAQVRTIDLNLLRLLGLWNTPESAYINVAVYLKEAALEGTIHVWIFKDVKSSVHIHKSVEPKSR